MLLMSAVVSERTPLRRRGAAGFGAPAQPAVPLKEVPVSHPSAQPVDKYMYVNRDRNMPPTSLCIHTVPTVVLL